MRVRDETFRKEVLFLLAQVICTRSDTAPHLNDVPSNSKVIDVFTVGRGSSFPSPDRRFMANDEAK